MTPENLGSFQFVQAPIMGKILQLVEMRDITSCSCSGKSMSLLVNKALESVSYMPGESKQAVVSLLNTVGDLSWWLRSAHPLPELRATWRVMRNLMVHGHQLDTLACSRADWELIDATFQMMQIRIQSLANLWLLKNSLPCDPVSNFNNYQTPKGNTYLMILAAAGKWEQLSPLITVSQPLVFNINEAGDTLLTTILLRGLKKDEPAIHELALRIVQLGGMIKQPGDDRALALAARLNMWDIVDHLLSRDANPCHVMLLPEGNEICPLISLLQSQRLGKIHPYFRNANAIVSELPVIASRCLLIPKHPFAAYILDEEPDLFLDCLAKCNQNELYFHPFTGEKEYPIQLLAESNQLNFPGAVSRLIRCGANIDACGTGEQSMPFLSKWIKLLEDFDPVDAQTLRGYVNSYKPNFQMRDGKGCTLFHYASQKEQPAVLEVLVDNLCPTDRFNAMVLTMDEEGVSAAMHAAYCGGQKTREYLRRVLKIEQDLNAFDLSLLALEHGGNPLNHLKIILTSNLDKESLLKNIRKLVEIARSRGIENFITSQDAAVIIASYSPSFAMEPMRELLGLQFWHEWISKVWYGITEKWVAYYIKHHQHSDEWCLMLNTLPETILLNKHTIHYQLVLGAARNPDVSCILAPWLAKFNIAHKKSEPSLLMTYLEEGGKDENIITSLTELTSQPDIEKILIKLWNSGQYIESEIYSTLLKRLQSINLMDHAEFRHAHALWRLTFEDPENVKKNINTDI